jgi:hypothetical protein
LTTEDIDGCLKEIEKALKIISNQNDVSDITAEELNTLKGNLSLNLSLMLEYTQRERERENMHVIVFIKQYLNKKN